MDLLNIAKVLEASFIEFHGESMNKQPGVITKLKKIMQDKIPHNIIPEEVLACMIRTRTYIRIREMNWENQRKQIP